MNKCHFSKIKNKTETFKIKRVFFKLLLIVTSNSVIKNN